MTKKLKRKWPEEDLKIAFETLALFKPEGGWEVENAFKEATQKTAAILSIRWGEDINENQIYMLMVPLIKLKPPFTNSDFLKLKQALATNLYTREEFNKWMMQK